MLETITLLNSFILLPIWAGYTCDNMLLFVGVALLFISPGAILALKMRNLEKRSAEKNGSEMD